MMCGVCPIPASSGKTQRHRLNRGGNRQPTFADAILDRIVHNAHRIDLVGPSMRKAIAENINANAIDHTEQK